MVSHTDLPVGLNGSFPQDARSAAGQKPSTVSLLCGFPPAEETYPARLCLFPVAFREFAMQGYKILVTWHSSKASTRGRGDRHWDYLELDFSLYPVRLFFSPSFPKVLISRAPLKQILAQEIPSQSLFSNSG